MTTIRVSSSDVSSVVPAAGRGRLDTMLLASGVVAAVWYVLITVIVGFLSPGYHALDQTVSELSAVGAPTRDLWMLLCIPYMALSFAFAWGVRRASRGTPALRTASTLLLAMAVTGQVWPFAPMHTRDVLAAGGESVTDTMHIALGVITTLLMFLVMSAAARRFGRRFTLYTATSLILLVIFALPTFASVSDVGRNQPTPGIGLWERLDIATFMVWQAVFAVLVVRTRDNVLS